MSDVEPVKLVEEVLVKEVALLQRTLSALEKEIISCFRVENADRVQVIEDELKKGSGKLTNELLSVKDALLAGYERLGKLVKQLTPTPTCSIDIGDEISDEPPIEAKCIVIIESSRGAADEASDIESMKSKDEEISAPKNPINLADKKLEERKEELLKQMEKMAGNVQQLNKLIKDSKVKEISELDGICSVTESMQGVISEMMGHIKCVGTNTTTADSSVRTTDFSDYLQRLRKLYPQLAEKLSAEPVAAELYQNEVLTLSQLQQVQFSQTPVTAAECLLNQLLDIRPEVSYECFRRALLSTNQEHIYLWLSHDDNDIDSQHNDLIRQNYTFLLNHLNSKDTGLIAQLFQYKVIDHREKQFLEICEGAVDQAVRLLSVLSRKSAEQFKQFLTALDETGQQHVAHELRSQPYDVSSGAGDFPINVCDDSPTSNASTIPCVIGASEDRKGKVSGLTVHGDELFIVRFRFKGLIEVYNVTDFTFKHNVYVPEGEGSCSGLTSCDSNNCLYVSSYVYSHGAGYIAKVKPTGNNEVVKWKAEDDFKPHGLSVNCEHNLLVACSSRRPVNALFEYQTDGKLVRRILLEDEVVDLHHAVQLKSNHFVVSHGFGDGDGSLHRVCVVDANGLVLLRYGNKPGSKAERLNKPRNLAVDRGGFIFVADCGNDRIVVLNSKLKWSHDLKLVDDGVSGGVTLPYSLYLDDKRSKLFVGEENGDDSRVIVVKTNH